MEHYLGKGQIDLLAWLTNRWLTAGKPVCFLEGFPGIGKTTVARELEVQLKQPHQVLRVDMPEAEADPVGDLLLELATRLYEVGHNQIADAIDGGRDKAAAALVNLLRSSPMVIVIDEFQRAFRKDEGRPVLDVEALILRLAQRTGSQGRVLLLTNRRVAHEKWSEPYDIRTLPGLTLEEAEQLLAARLASEGRSDEVPLEERRDVVNWLGRNPRAIGVLVAALAVDSLAYLISRNPESWEARDRDVSAELLRSLEKNLLERNLDRLESDVADFLYQLSVYRRAFKREAMQRMATDAQNFEAMKSVLVNRFFVEHHRGWFSLHEIVREIALQKLRQNPPAFKQAQSKAGEYFARPFKAKSMVGGGELGAQFVEARYHLVQAQREEELNNIANRFGNYLKETFSTAAPIPQQKNELDERIAVLSALLVTSGSKSLEYYLARLLKHRGNLLDIKRALEHARVATDSRDARTERWMLRIELEEQVHGVAEAINAARQGITKVPREQSAPLYQICAELMAQANRIEEAIALLKDSISKIPPDKSLESLYQICAELMAKDNRTDEAITLLKDGISKIPPDKGLFALYQICAELMAKDNRTDEAITLLKDGISKIPPDKSLESLYQICAELMAQANRIEEAIALLKDSISKIPPDKNLFALYETYSKVLSKINKLDEAIAVLREGMRAIPVGRWGRYILIREAIYLCAAVKNESLLDSILTGTGKDVVEPQSLWLGRVVGLQIRQEWRQAAKDAQSGRNEFPDNLHLAILEAFSWLCANQPEAAERALREFPRPTRMEQGDPIGWLRAFIALRNGKPTEARNCLAAFLGHPLADSEEISEARLLRLWDTPRDLFAGPHVSFLFPTLPPSLTGLPEAVTRQSHSPHVLPDSLPHTTQPTPIAATSQEAEKAVLVVATEWESKYGGLSTFNRELCKAMSRAGHRVCCLVPRATPDEISASKAAGVELVQATPTEEASDRELLFRRPALPTGFDPQIIIGHDRITGTAAQAQVEDFFPQSRFVLFIHTAPGEIEWYKPRAEGENTAAEKAEQREKAQRELGRKASLVVAVGPRLRREIEVNLVGLNIPVMQLNPGLGETRQPVQPLEAIYCLLLGRAEDEDLKGLDIAARALGQLSQKQPNPFPVEPKLIIRGATPKTGDQLRQRLIGISAANLDVKVKEYTAQLERITEDIQRASVVLMPSRREGFGLVGLEAITASIPVLVSAQSGLGELLKEKLPDEISRRFIIPVTGNLETDSHVWAEAIEFVLLDRKAAFARATELQRLLANSISWERCVTELFQALTRITA